MITRICKECGKQFILTDGEIDFYEKKGLNLPKRCKYCRQSKKANSSITYNYHTPSKRKKSQISMRFSLAFVIVSIILVAVIAKTFISNKNDFSWNTLESGNSIPLTNVVPNASNAENSPPYTFRNKDLREEHYQKHGVKMGFHSAEEYEIAASAVVTDSAALHKIESEDGDDVYNLEASNEFVIVSTNGYIRTYFHPEDRIAYFNRQ